MSFAIDGPQSGRTSGSLETGQANATPMMQSTTPARLAPARPRSRWVFLITFSAISLSVAVMPGADSAATHADNNSSRILMLRNPEQYVAGFLALIVAISC
eukprot:6426598-Pyramimonas_sp.AAC.1